MDPQPISLDKTIFQNAKQNDEIRSKSCVCIESAIGVIIALGGIFVLLACNNVLPQGWNAFRDMNIWGQVAGAGSVALGLLICVLSVRKYLKDDQRSHEFHQPNAYKIPSAAWTTVEVEKTSIPDDFPFDNAKKMLIIHPEEIEAKKETTAESQEDNEAPQFEKTPTHEPYNEAMSKMENKINDISLEQIVTGIESFNFCCARLEATISIINESDSQKLKTDEPIYFDHRSIVSISELKAKLAEVKSASIEKLKPYFSNRDLPVQIEIDCKVTEMFNKFNGKFKISI